jgi:peptide/nickel transport system substrate-binding protein
MAGTDWLARGLGRRVTRRGALIAGGSAAFLAACGGGEEKKTTGQATAGPGTPAAAGGTAVPASQQKVGGTVRYPMYGISSQNPPTIFPFENLSYLAQTPGAYMYSRLLRSVAGPGIADTDHTKLEGDIAAKLPEQVDNVTYVFTMKPNVTFHDKPPLNGRTATARDFVNTWEYFKAKSQNAGAFNSVIDKVEAPDDKTIKFTLKNTFAPFLTTHASSPEGIWLIPVETIESGQAQKDPVGTGPWIFRQWETGVAIRFDRHPKFHDSPLPYFAKVEGGLVGDPQRIVAGLQTGDLDLSGLSGILYPDAKSKLDPRGQEIFTPTLVLSGFIFNFDIKPWADKRVRQALSMALDRDGYLKVQDLTGKGNWHSFLSPGLAPFYLSPKTDKQEFGPNAKYFEKNIAEAKRLLEAAGVQTPLRFKLYCNVDAYGAEAKQAWELIAQTIPEAGFQPELVFQEYGTWIQSSYLAKFPDLSVNSAAVSPLIGAPRDPDDIFFRNFASVSARKNWGGTPIPEMADLDARFAKQRTILNLEERIKEIKEIQRVMAESMLTVPLHGNAGYGYVQPWVVNYFNKAGYGNPMESVAKASFTDERLKKG